MVDEVKEVAVARAPGCHLAARRRHSNACPRSRPCQSHRLRASLRIASCSTSLRGHKNRKRLAWNHTQASNPHPDEPRASSKYRTTTARKKPKEEVPVPVCSFSIIVFAHFISKLAATLDAYNGYGARYR